MEIERDRKHCMAISIIVKYICLADVISNSRICSVSIVFVEYLNDKIFYLNFESSKLDY